MVSWDDRAGASHGATGTAGTTDTTALSTATGHYLLTQIGEKIDIDISELSAYFASLVRIRHIIATLNVHA